MSARFCFWCRSFASSPAATISSSPTETATLGSDLPENDERADYLRALLKDGPDGPVATPFPTQDSSMMAPLAQAGCLVIRATARAGGESRQPLRDGPARSLSVRSTPKKKARDFRPGPLSPNTPVPNVPRRLVPVEAPDQLAQHGLFIGLRVDAKPRRRPPAGLNNGRSALLKLENRYSLRQNRPEIGSQLKFSAYSVPPPTNQPL